MKGWTFDLFHITTPENAEKILQEGFTTGRIYFTIRKLVPYWKKKLERNVIVKVKITRQFFFDEIYMWDMDEFSSGPPGEFSYGEGWKGWNAPEKRPQLKHGVNCELELTTEFDEG
jgi:hypothetical protein